MNMWQLKFRSAFSDNHDLFKDSDVNLRKLKFSVKPPTILRAITDTRGFTLIELLIVIAILAVLSVMTLNGLYRVKERARVSRAMSEIRILEKEATAYSTDKASFPAQLLDINRATALAPNTSTLLDPWGQPYVYTIPSTRTNAGPKLNDDFDIYSKGPDTISAGGSIVDDEDDIIRADQGRFIGFARNYGM